MTLTEKEKYELLDINHERFKKFISETIYELDGKVISGNEVENICMTVIESVDFEIDLQEIQETNKFSMRVMNEKTVVIKAKTISVQNIFKFVPDYIGIVSGKGVDRILAIVKTILDIFLEIMEDDESVVYMYLAYTFFTKKEKIKSEEISDIIQKYFIEELGENISNIKVRKIINKLENEYRVIGFDNGYLIVKDKIYFA